MHSLDGQKIRNAQKQFAGHVFPSPLVYSHYLSQRTRKRIFLKLESLQDTGSFKIRGAFHKLSSLDEEAKKRGVIAASAGNHGQGVAWTAHKLGIQALIVMPEGAPLKKILAVKEYGAQVNLLGSSYEDARKHALELSRRTGKILIPAFDDPYIIAGQGTVALEVLDALTEVETFIVPVGGGGLISGIALAAKEHHPSIEIIGVQASRAAPLTPAFQQHKAEESKTGYTLADGIAVKRPGEMTSPIIHRYVDRVVTVEEEEIAEAILLLLERKNLVVEGAGAAPLAALISSKAKVAGHVCVLIISGGNIDLNLIDRIIQKGSVKMGRLIRLKIDLLDVPGSLYRLTGILAEEKANILHIFHDRLSLDNPLNVSRVELNLETKGRDHADKILSRLAERGYPAKMLE